MLHLGIKQQSRKLAYVIARMRTLEFVGEKLRLVRSESGAQCRPRD